MHSNHPQTALTALTISCGVIALALGIATISGCTPRRAADASTLSESTETARTAQAQALQAETPAPQLHPAFAIDSGTLETLIGELPTDTQTRIWARPQYFLELVAKTLDEPIELWVLVDKLHALPADYVPTDLVALDNYAEYLRLTRPEMLLRSILIPDLLAMSETAALQNIALDISSSYRSYNYQSELFERRSAVAGHQEAARDTAPAGHSQHQLGLAIDFGSISDGFAATPAGRWLMQHAWRFGFSLSYPQGYEQQTGYRYESWHYRYIGRAAAELGQEFFAGLQQQMLEFFAAQSARLSSHRLHN